VHACAVPAHAVQARAVHAVRMLPYWTHTRCMYCTRLHSMYRRHTHMCCMHLISESHLSPSQHGSNRQPCLAATSPYEVIVSPSDILFLKPITPCLGMRRDQSWVLQIVHSCMVQHPDLWVVTSLLSYFLTSFELVVSPDWCVAPSV
jgi:hypothetical protein